MAPPSRPLRVIAAPDSFRGSLDAAAVAAAMAAGVRDVHPDAQVRELPVADGGEGTVASALSAGFRAESVPARGPLGEPGRARIAVRGQQAVIELAELCGWPRVVDNRLDPLRAGTEGLGDGIRAALDLGCDELFVGVGGSVSTDGGLGMLRALGAQPLDVHGRPTPPGGGGLAALDRIELTGLDARLHGAHVVLATDVQNPLLGARGAAAVFAPQKGATAQDVQLLEAGLTRLAQVIQSATGISVAGRPGAGAAGGVGACAVAYLGAQVAFGADLVLDLLGFDHLARDADLVLTGEGSWDEQTARSKTPARVARRAAAAGASVGVVAGVLTVSGAELAAAGVDASCALSDLEPERSRSVQRAAELVRVAAARVTAAISVQSEEQR